MNDWQERVSKERDELTGKLTRLREFIGGPIYNGLSDVDRGLLARQRDVMSEYLALLHERIASWE